MPADLECHGCRGRRGPYCAACPKPWRRELTEQRALQAKQANAPAKADEKPEDRRAAEVESIIGQANLSTDGSTLPLRDEGRKGVRLVAVSDVQGGRPQPARARNPAEAKRIR